MRAFAGARGSVAWDCNERYGAVGVPTLISLNRHGITNSMLIGELALPPASRDFRLMPNY